MMPAITSNKLNGFTTIELIVTLIIMAILATTIVPKFFTKNGFEEFTYRNEVITKIRGIQLRAMQQTNSTECHVVLVNQLKLGIPDDCDVTPSFGTDWKAGTTGVIIESDNGVQFNVSGGNYFFSFDQMGRPIGCSDPCLIIIDGGESSLTVKIESEGYIHAL
jgi:MSHA pilin protein MshC